MANHDSAKKRIRRNARRTEINRNRVARIRTFVKKVERALDLGDHAAALAALQQAEPELARGANRGVIHARTASRKISRLTRRVKVLGGEGPAMTGGANSSSSSSAA